jgi:integrase
LPRTRGNAARQNAADEKEDTMSEKKATRNARGLGRVYRRGPIWWVSYWVNGEERRESLGRDPATRRPRTQQEAGALLRQRLQELASGRTFHDAARVLLSDLRSLIENDYILQERRSGVRLAQNWRHLGDYFGKDEPAVEITTSRLKAYVAHRLEQTTMRGTATVSRGTIKNELNALRRAFKLAQACGTLLANEVPIFPTIKGSDPRQGFFEREEHDRVRAALPSDEGDLAEWLYWTGWRVSEARALTWMNVDRKAKVIRIETTKNSEPRTLPYGALPVLVDLIEHRWTLKDAVQKKRGKVVQRVFNRNGEPIAEFRRSWKTACIAAGLGQELREPDLKDDAGKVIRRGRLRGKVATRKPHDYRRSAARNLSRAGVPETVIMKLCGWKTRTVFDRYRIVAERDLAEGLARLAGVPAEAPAPPKVTSIVRGRKAPEKS